MDNVSVDFSGGHTDRNGMREGSGNVADVVSKINDKKHVIKIRRTDYCDYNFQWDKTFDERAKQNSFKMVIVVIFWRLASKWQCRDSRAKYFRKPSGCVGVEK